MKWFHLAAKAALLVVLWIVIWLCWTGAKDRFGASLADRVVCGLLACAWVEELWNLDEKRRR